MCASCNANGICGFRSHASCAVDGGDRPKGTYSHSDIGWKEDVCGVDGVWTNRYWWVGYEIRSKGERGYVGIRSRSFRVWEDGVEGVEQMGR